MLEEPLTTFTVGRGMLTPGIEDHLRQVAKEAVIGYPLLVALYCFSWGTPTQARELAIGILRSRLGTGLRRQVLFMSVQHAYTDYQALFARTYDRVDASEIQSSYWRRKVKSL